MISKLFRDVLVYALFLSSQVYAQAQVDTSTTGALTPLSSKSKICNVLDYGAAADNKTDIGPAIIKAFSSCASSGGATIYIPPGSYSIATGVTLNKGSAYAIQIDGLITLTSDGSFGGNAIVIENASDVEVFSSNTLGAINGQGYITRITSSGQNARLLRFISCENISIHDIILVDSPTFHLVFNSVSNLEAYQITIRGPNKGGTDGIDLICTDNCWLHDIEVTNRDECVSVKSPSQNVLIENMYCNQSGGMSIGSLTADGVTSSADAAAVSNITMRNIYIHQCTQMLMIKTFPGGSGATGYVKNSLFENFWAYDTTYGLDIDQYWESHTTPDTGAVALSSLTFNNWTGTVDNGVSRGPIVIRGSDIVPLTDITLTNIDMWTVNQNKILNQCKNVYGTGYCAGTSTASSLTTFTTTVTTTSPPVGFTSPTSPAWGLGTTGYGLTIPIPIYTPAVFWSPASAGVASGSATSDAVTSSASSAAAVKTSAASTGSSPSSKVATSTEKAATAIVTSLAVSPPTSSSPSTTFAVAGVVTSASESSSIVETLAAAGAESTTISEFTPSISSVSTPVASSTEATASIPSISASSSVTSSEIPVFTPSIPSNATIITASTTALETTLLTSSIPTTQSGLPLPSGAPSEPGYNPDEWECKW